MSCKRILLVEDEAITGIQIREMLLGMGYEPYGPVASGHTAVAVALAIQPDLVLMDVMLKGPMNGIEAAEAIRSQWSCPVIYLTGSSDQVRTNLLQLTEPFELILKPIDEYELDEAIKKALHHRGVESACG